MPQCLPIELRLKKKTDIQKKSCPRRETELAEGHLCSCVRIRSFSHGLEEMLTAGPCPYLVRRTLCIASEEVSLGTRRGETMREQPSGLKNDLRGRKSQALTNVQPPSLIRFAVLLS